MIRANSTPAKVMRSNKAHRTTSALAGRATAKSAPATTASASVATWRRNLKCMFAKFEIFTGRSYQDRAALACGTTGSQV
jgi:hypothetical protein